MHKVLPYIEARCSKSRKAEEVQEETQEDSVALELVTEEILEVATEAVDNTEAHTAESTVVEVLVEKLPHSECTRTSDFQIFASLWMSELKTAPSWTLWERRCLRTEQLEEPRANDM